MKTGLDPSVGSRSSAETADYNLLRGVEFAALRGRIKANIAVEEAFVTALLDFRGDPEVRISEDEARHVTDLVRRHHVGLVKQRALMGAMGIDV